MARLVRSAAGVMGYYNSFILRVWSDAHGTVRGTIEHVGSRDTLAFADPEWIVPFLRAHLGAPPDPMPLSADGLYAEPASLDDDGPNW